MNERYFYKDKPYITMYEARMKIGQQWLDCIVYRSEIDEHVYVRERDDFYEKFKPEDKTY